MISDMLLSGACAMRNDTTSRNQHSARTVDVTICHLYVQDSPPPTLAHADRRGTDLSGFGEGRP
jgi:hypothetical protein